MSEEPVSHNGTRRIYRILCHLAWCDGEVHITERQLLDAFVAHHGIRPDEAASLEQEGRECRGLGVSKQPSERRMMIDAMIDLAAVDRQLVAAEQNRLLRFGNSVGLSEQEVAARVVHRVKSSGKDLAPTQRLRKRP